MHCTMLNTFSTSGLAQRKTLPVCWVQRLRIAELAGAILQASHN